MERKVDVRRGSGTMQFAPYRIERRPRIRGYSAPPDAGAGTVKGAAAGKLKGLGADSAGEGLASYLGRLTRLLPAEVLGLYLTFRGVAGTDGAASGATSDGDSFSVLWPVICWVLVILSRIWGSRPPGTRLSQALRTAQWPVVVISGISFVIWVYATGDNFFGWVIADQRWIGAAVGVWTFLIPWFYKGD